MSICVGACNRAQGDRVVSVACRSLLSCPDPARDTEDEVIAVQVIGLVAFRIVELRRISGIGPGGNPAHVVGLLAHSRVPVVYVDDAVAGRRSAAVGILHRQHEMSAVVREPCKTAADVGYLVWIAIAVVMEQNGSISDVCDGLE